MKKTAWKYLSLIVVTLLSFGFTICAAVESVAQNYRTVTEVHDWGAAIPRVIVDLGENVEEGAVDTETFKVYVKRSIPQRIKRQWICTRSFRHP